MITLLPGLADINAELKTMVGWLNDPENVRFSEQRHQQHDIESQHHYVLDGPDVFRRIYADDKFVGTITAYTDRNNSVADVGILIGKAYWGKGYGFMAWSQFCNDLFNNGIRKIEAGCMSINYAMINICRRYKMFHEGTRLNHFLCDAEVTGDMPGLHLWGKFRETI